jgi:hypothetical protein
VQTRESIVPNEGEEGLNEVNKKCGKMLNDINMSRKEK